MNNMNNINNMNNMNSNYEESTESERKYVFTKGEIYFDFNEKYEQTDYDTQSYHEDDYFYIINPEGLPVKPTHTLYDKIM